MFVIVCNKNHHQFYFGGFDGQTAIWVQDPLSAIGYKTFMAAENVILGELYPRKDLVVVKYR